MVTRTPTANMTREEWASARSRSLGGSDAASVMGLNPWKSPYALWAEKTGTAPAEDISGKEAVRLGTYLEDYVARRFTEETGIRVRRENAILKNDAYPFAHANVDRLCIGEKAGLECKTTSELNLSRFRDGEYPPTYYCQCVHYMAITGLPKWYLAVLIGSREFRVFTIERSQDEIDALMAREERFWNLVQTGTPPAVDSAPSTALALEEQWKDADNTVSDLTPVSSAIRDYRFFRDARASAQDGMDKAANEIKAYMGASTSGSWDTFSVRWSPASRSRLDEAALRRDHPEIDFTPYLKTTTTRRFDLREKKGS